MEQYFKIGIVTAPFGVKGEMKVYPTTDDPARFKKCKTVYYRRSDSAEALSEMPVFEVESARVHKGMVLLKVKGIETPEDVAKLKKIELYVDREHAVRLKKDEYFVADLMGMEVLTEDGAKLGIVEDVQSTGANDVYLVRLTQGGLLPVPAIKECILEVDPEAGQMKIHVLEGLMDLVQEPKSGSEA
ncbi:MAG: ribosome maturation factor RimM [Lachnospiraceae bacterium]|nr:ribosome maturation factor RimM [Lachnospiraceae bacterium]